MGRSYEHAQLSFYNRPRRVSGWDGQLVSHSLSAPCHIFLIAGPRKNMAGGGSQSKVCREGSVVPPVLTNWHGKPMLGSVWRRAFLKPDRTTSSSPWPKRPPMPPRRRSSVWVRAAPRRLGGLLGPEPNRVVALPEIATVEIGARCLCNACLSQGGLGMLGIAAAWLLYLCLLRYFQYVQPQAFAYVCPSHCHYGGSRHHLQGRVDAAPEGEQGPKHCRGCLVPMSAGGARRGACTTLGSNSSPQPVMTFFIGARKNPNHKNMESVQDCPFKTSSSSKRPHIPTRPGLIPGHRTSGRHAPPRSTVTSVACLSFCTLLCPCVQDVHIPSASKLRVKFSNRCATTDDCASLQVLAGRARALGCRDRSHGMHRTGTKARWAQQERCRRWGPCSPQGNHRPRSGTVREPVSKSVAITPSQGPQAIGKTLGFGIPEATQAGE